MKKRILLFAVFVLLQTTALPYAWAHSSADFLFENSEQFYEPNISSGPWVYHSKNLTVCIKKTYEYKQLCYIADIFLRNNEKAYTGWAKKKPYTRTVELPHKIARRYGAVFAITGDYISHSKNKKGVMIRDGITYYNKKDADTLAVFPNGEMQVYTKGSVTAKELISQGVADSLGFGPIIVKDGKTTKAAATHPLKPKNIRAGIGRVEAGHYIAIVSRGKFTFKEYAQVFLNYGCEWAYNLDGGHSAAMIIMGEQINVHWAENILGADSSVRQRPVPDVLLIGNSALVPDVNKKATYKGSR